MKLHQNIYIYITTTSLIFLRMVSFLGKNFEKDNITSHGVDFQEQYSLECMFCGLNGVIRWFGAVRIF